MALLSKRELIAIPVVAAVLELINGYGSALNLIGRIIGTTIVFFIAYSLGKWMMGRLRRRKK